MTRIEMDNEEFQSIVRQGDILHFGRSNMNSGVKGVFLGFKKCKNDNPLCETCKGYIKYRNIKTKMVHDGCHRMESSFKGINVQLTVESNCLTDEDVLI